MQSSEESIRVSWILEEVDSEGGEIDRIGGVEARPQHQQIPEFAEAWQRIDVHLLARHRDPSVRSDRVPPVVGEQPTLVAGAPCRVADCTRSALLVERGAAARCSP